jgi:hypothetical protein
MVPLRGPAVEHVVQAQVEATMHNKSRGRKRKRWGNGRGRVTTKLVIIEEGERKSPSI